MVKFVVKNGYRMHTHIFQFLTLPKKVQFTNGHHNQVHVEKQVSDIYNAFNIECMLIYYQNRQLT
jgi:hypothetical protein